MLQRPDLNRDLRGWFYRAVAPGPDCAVLQVGEGFLENWFTNVSKAERGQLPKPDSSRERFDLVVLHYSLGGCATPRSAIVSATQLLRQGGRLAVAGENRLRAFHRATQSKDSQIPRATAWGLESMMEKAGLKNVALFFTHPSNGAPMYVVHTARPSGRDVLRTALKLRKLPVWSPTHLALIALIELNVMPYLQPGLLAVGEKC